ncbi:NIF-domain-containing protein [Annulohypoxylon truncatum]|uniref:NIF-domain-containing protein n=1 Tax=Annulohypoxylon truncatum TaxID=327061 RepID=UPI002008AB51|nr:NIF-domain-containing protein [Annulohypoxylon truncatum]KAI1205668.1 NIF-domain-containing protein [Annulohypoxylon truncatum]
MLSRALMRSARLPALSRSTIAHPAISRISNPTAAIWVRGMAKNRTRNRNHNQGQNQQSRPNQPSAGPAQAAQSARPAQSAQSDQSAQSAQYQAPKPSSEPTPSTQPSQGAEAESKSEPDLSSLPDLTQGIPSTLEYETSGATDKAALASVEEEAPGAQSGGGRGRGELPASAYISSTEKKRMRFANFMYAGSLVLAVLGVAYLGREWDEEEAQTHTDIPNGWSLGLWYKRTMARFGDVTSYYSEPAFEKLLPDPDPMFARPYTLCISLEDMLVHSEWTREHGWRVAKRPGVDYFLRYLSQYYELVLFTSVPFAIGEPLVRKLDPFRFIVWPLFREATKYKDGEIVKDLSYLNRDLSKVIIIDSKAEHVRNQPENAIVLNKWTGDPKDTELVSLIPFLEYIHTMQYKDVRVVLKSFEGKHIPTEFARREAIARKEFQKKFESEKRKRKSGMGALGSLIGLKPSNMNMMVPAEGEISPSEAFAQGKMLQDIARERGQRNYQMMEKEIRENGEKWLKEEQQANEKAQAEAMSSMKSSFSSWFLPSKPEDNPAPAPTPAEPNK